MDDKMLKILSNHVVEEKACQNAPNTVFSFLVQIPQKIQNCLKSHLKHFGKTEKPNEVEPIVFTEKESHTALALHLDKQMKAWKENPNWVDQPPELRVTIPEGSLCQLNLKFDVGLPPDAVFNIVTDPDNKRVFKNIKEVLSRKVLIDEGLRQVVEVEQAAIWRFLWWSGTLSVHVYVDQNRKNHTVTFKQGKSGFMKKFEGCWKIEPLLVDEEHCYPHKPKTLSEYEYCTNGRGRVGSLVSLDQLIQLAIVPPPPISWYVRGITTRTSQMLIVDLMAEAARLRRAFGGLVSEYDLAASSNNGEKTSSDIDNSIKRRWHQRRSWRKNRRVKGVLVDQTP